MSGMQESVNFNAFGLMAGNADSRIAFAETLNDTVQGGFAAGETRIDKDCGLRNTRRFESSETVSVDRDATVCDADSIGFALTEQIQIQEEDERPRAKSREIEVGSVVADRYEILSEISRGGYGIVYRARQIGVNRIVALKRLRSQDDPSVNQRFLMEADIIKDLIHPNTIQLIDAGMDGRHLYIVMEYIEGKSLRVVMRNARILKMHRAVHITEQILKSINEAHQRGIIHRDLKPSNIIIRQVVGEEDFVKVLDFGIAKSQNIRGAKLTQTGKVMGTPQYLAPELFYGEEATPAADIYAVGLMLVEMVTGKPVMPRDLNDILKIMTSPGEIKIPEWIDQSEIGHIVRKALSKNVKDRYQSAQEMLDDLLPVEYALLAQKYAADLDTQEREVLLPAKKESKGISALMIAAMVLIVANAVLLIRLLF